VTRSFLVDSEPCLHEPTVLVLRKKVDIRIELSIITTGEEEEKRRREKTDDRSLRWFWRWFLLVRLSV